MPGEPWICDQLFMDTLWHTGGFLAPAYGFAEWAVVSQDAGR